MTVAGSWGSSATASKHVKLVPGSNTVDITLVVPAKTVALWWPNELGFQTLYNLSATWVPDATKAAVKATSTVSITRRIGFR